VQVFTLGGDATIGAIAGDNSFIFANDGNLFDDGNGNTGVTGTNSIWLSADGTLGEGITCSVRTGRALAEAGLHTATGGDGLSLCSGDMLLEALAACAGVTLRAVATSLGIPVAGGTIHVEGDLDFRGTLSISKEVPVGLQNVRLRFHLDTDATDDAEARDPADPERSMDFRYSSVVERCRAGADRDRPRIRSANVPASSGSWV